MIAAHGGKPYAINYFLASPDGSKVAVGVSEGGSEAAAISVYDAATGARIAGPIDRADFGATVWSPDSKTLYFIRLKQLGPGEIPAPKNITTRRLVAWDLKSAPVAALRLTIGKGPKFSARRDTGASDSARPRRSPSWLLDQRRAERSQGCGQRRSAEAANPNAPWKLFVRPRRWSHLGRCPRR